MKLLFAIDIDGCWTADPALFNAFVVALVERGHQAIIVTGRQREDNSDFGRYDFPEGLRIFATGGEPKKAFMARVHGLCPDIWIDDNPHMIGDGDEDALSYYDDDLGY